MVMILWKHHVSEHFPNGRTPKSEVHGVGKGGDMHEDLVTLIDLLQKEGRQWSIAKIECERSDVEPSGTKWYRALRDIPSKDGFMPLEDAERLYLS